jgi:hypothetical protein
MRPETLSNTDTDTSRQFPPGPFNRKLTLGVMIRQHPRDFTYLTILVAILIGIISGWAVLLTQRSALGGGDTDEKGGDDKDGNDADQVVHQSTGVMAANAAFLVLYVDIQKLFGAE